jgi:hypothetical protein
MQRELREREGKSLMNVVRGVVIDDAWGQAGWSVRPSRDLGLRHK